MAIQVLKDKCVGCGACVSACPFSAISMVDGKASIGTACTDVYKRQENTIEEMNYVLAKLKEAVMRFRKLGSFR